MEGENPEQIGALRLLAIATGKRGNADMNWNLILDILIAALLIPTIVYAVILNRRLGALRKNRDELAKVIEAFNEATVRAQSSIPGLRKSSEDAAGRVREQVERAQVLRDDLAYMIERADTMANRLETAVRSARGEAKPSPKGAEPVAATTVVAQPVRQMNEDVGTSREPARREPSVAAMPTRTATRLSEPRKAMAVAAEPDQEFSVDDERSEAERELLRALQSAR